MARPQSINEEALLGRLSGVFRNAGYEGASLAMLSKASGLQKASLYHRFPDGKQQMAEEVLAAALSWFEEHILSPLAEKGTPAARVARVANKLAHFYAGGRKACLLNMLSAPLDESGPFSDTIRGAFGALIGSFAAVARDAGHSPKEARTRAKRVVMLLHGSLVMSRGLRSPKPFRYFLGILPAELLKPKKSSSRRANR